MGNEDLTNKEVVRCITLWVQNMAVEEWGVFSQVDKYLILVTCFCFQEMGIMVSRMVIVQILVLIAHQH